MLNALKNQLFNIKTSDAYHFINRWVAIISVLATYLILALSIWNLLVDDVTPPIIIHQPSRIIVPNDNGIMNNFWYFNGIGISNPSTNFSSIPGINKEEIAQKCKLFGNDCIGFDTIGSIFLKRDTHIATLRGLDKQYKGGFYMVTNKTDAESMCKNMGGTFTELKRECNNINRSLIKDYPLM